MLIKVLYLENGRTKASTLFEADQEPGAVSLVVLQEFCAKEFQLPVECLKLQNWKGNTLCSGLRRKFDTLAAAGVQDLDRLTAIRVAAPLVQAIPPVRNELQGPPLRLPRRSVQVPTGAKRVVTEDRYYPSPSKAAVPRQIAPWGLPLHLQRRRTPRDAHCLYRCLSELLFDGGEHTSSLRMIAANTIAGRPKVFPSEVLKGSAQEYGTKVLNPASWGGYIELNAFALEYSVALCVYSVDSSRLNVYGQAYEKAHGRFYLICDDVHYDWVRGRTPEGTEYRVFSHDDETVIAQVKTLATQDEVGPIKTVSGGERSVGGRASTAMRRDVTPTPSNMSKSEEPSPWRGTAAIPRNIAAGQAGTPTERLSVLNPSFNQTQPMASQTLEKPRNSTPVQQPPTARPTSRPEARQPQSTDAPRSLNRVPLSPAPQSEPPPAIVQASPPRLSNPQSARFRQPLTARSSAPHSPHQRVSRPQRPSPLLAHPPVNQGGGAFQNKGPLPTHGSFQNQGPIEKPPTVISSAATTAASSPAPKPTHATLPEN
eukprot:Protomagalhaensia_wolfi_Nauph_80__5133@NODE_548_length_2327_cov_58_473776_g408_i0_p1_GENE_NODE_548_length_2327_cov_58_473776_g408_i0NODE_548_length_2327_cov_58_473776_g408_i0_p1_ORF_typecomplete_len540_score94_03OTU/PF02338_19/4_9e11_NODE_548_length_2327_cov_58_473776_g408_i06962315